MKSNVKEAAQENVAAIVGLLADMQSELKEFGFDKSVVAKSVSESLNENVHWFLFVDENNKTFGTCYMQSVHNYWRAGRRYYRGGFYIMPSHRGQGRYREIDGLLKAWAASHGGVQIYAHIHKDNEKSLKAAASVGMEETDYRLCANHWGDA